MKIYVSVKQAGKRKKTAEIISKIILLTEDSKIKDPTVLVQITK